MSPAVVHEAAGAEVPDRTPNTSHVQAGGATLHRCTTRPRRSGTECFRPDRSRRWRLPDTNAAATPAWGTPRRPQPQQPPGEAQAAVAPGLSHSPELVPLSRRRSPADDQGQHHSCLPPSWSTAPEGNDLLGGGASVQRRRVRGWPAGSRGPAAPRCLVGADELRPGPFAVPHDALRTVLAEGLREGLVVLLQRRILAEAMTVMPGARGGSRNGPGQRALLQPPVLEYKSSRSTTKTRVEPAGINVEGDWLP